jgi:enoyl-CoA hydratase/carnithine racemase
LTTAGGASAAPSRLVSLERDGRIGIVTLERPDALNAISGALADELAGVLRELADDDSVWVVVITGAGERAFCVGADLKERAGFSLADLHRNRVQIRRVFAALRAVPQPTIAAIFGYALGGGFELALSCDLVVAAEGTRLGLTEARVGLLPAGGGTQLLPRLVGPAKAKELIFTAARLDAAEAAALGLVSKVVAPGELRAATLSLASDICRSSPVAVRAAKRAVDGALGLPLGDGLALEHSAWAVVIASADRAEGIAAFNEKRDPRWSNR